MQSEHEYNLEEIVDAIGLTKTLALLTRICYGKAEHLRSNWQADDMAKVWERDAKRIDKIMFQVESD